MIRLHQDSPQKTLQLIFILLLISLPLLFLPLSPLLFSLLYFLLFLISSFNLCLSTNISLKKVPWMPSFFFYQSQSSQRRFVTHTCTHAHTYAHIHTHLHSPLHSSHRQERWDFVLSFLLLHLFPCSTSMSPRSFLLKLLAGSGNTA